MDYVEWTRLYIGTEVNSDYIINALIGLWRWEAKPKSYSQIFNF